MCETATKQQFRGSSEHPFLTRTQAYLSLLYPTSFLAFGVGISNGTTPVSSSCNNTELKHQKSLWKPLDMCIQMQAWDTTVINTWHISVMVSSKTPPASSAPSPTSFTFQALAGSRKSTAFNRTTCLAICTNIGLHLLPLQHIKTLLYMQKYWSHYDFLEHYYT